MKESITGRVGRIISGSFNALIDSIENAVPEVVMEEAIREIDGAIDDVRVELGKIIGNKHLASTRLMDENRKHEDLSEKIELAVTEKRDDLAEAAISQQLDIEAQIPVLENTIADCGAKEKELEGLIQALQAKKREMKDDLKMYLDTRQEAGSVAGSSNPSGVGGVSNVEVSVEKAGSSFDRVLEKATGIAGSRGGVTAKTAAQMSELEDLARNNRIKERLAAIKGNK